MPWAIPLQDLNSALARQGVETGSIERLRHYVRVEVYYVHNNLLKYFFFFNQCETLDLIIDRKLSRK